MKLKRGKRKVVRGIVISDKMQKTVIVRIKRYKKHPVYGKVVLQRTKVYAHDEDNSCKIGDEVLLMETRPLSKLKRWRVIKKMKEGEHI